MQPPPDLGLSLPAASLVTLCRREILPATLPQLAKALRQPELGQAITTLSQRHGVFGLMLLALQRSGLTAGLPAAVAESYEGSLRTLRRQAAFWDLERDLVVTTLTDAGIPIVLLKGAALRITAYADSVERPFGDLDVLVPEEAVDAAVRVLTERGYHGETEHRARLYREHHHHLILRKELGFIVEVHWALEPVRSPFLLDSEAFRREAEVRTARSGQPVHVPRAEHNVLHLATQNIEDGFARLGRIVDVDRVIRSDPARFDWPRLAAESIRMRVNGVLALSLRISELLFETQIPAGFSEGLQLSGMARAQLALLDPIGLMLEQPKRRSAQERLLLLWTIPDRRTRLKTLRAIQRGEHDSFLKFLVAQGPGKVNLGSQRMTMIKLALYQLWLYCAAVGRSARGLQRVRHFWSGHPSADSAP